MPANQVTGIKPQSKSSDFDDSRIKPQSNPSNSVDYRPKCKICKVAFSRAYDIRRHMKIKHDPDVELKYVTYPYLYNIMS